MDYFKRRIAGYATLEIIQAGSKEQARWVTLLLGTSLIKATAIFRVMNTNPHCTRIGAWSEAIINTINADDFRSLSWSQARQCFATQKISKYCDFNIRNLVYPQQDKHTFEVRILPSSLDIEQFKLWGKVLHEVIFCG